MQNFEALDDPLSAPAAAGFLGIADSTFYRYLRRGDGPEHYRICGLIRIEKAAFREWLQSQKRDGAKPKGSA